MPDETRFLFRKIMKTLKRDILKGEKREQVTSLIQANLYNLIDLALQGKQAHWTVVGSHFRSVHLQLDEIIDAVREASDELAERIATLGIAPDGRARQVGTESALEPFPDGLIPVPEILGAYGDRLATAIDKLRDAIEVLGEIDPISEDLLIGISGGLEKHLWMWQAQEVK